MTAIKRYWWIWLLLSVVVAVCMPGMGQNSSMKEKIKLIPHKSIYRIVLLQENTFPEHEKMREGVIAALKSKGYVQSENANFEIYNGQGDLVQMEDQAKRIVHENPDLVIAIGTEAMKAVAKETKVIPAIGVGVFQFRSEPAFQNNDNLTGIADMPAILNQVRMASKIFPIKSLGIIFNPEDEEAVLQLHILREVGEKIKIENQVKRFIGNVDAVYIPSDEKIQNSFNKVVEILRQHKIPVIGENSEMVRQGALLSVSAEYYRMGFSGGRMAAKLLEGEKRPFEISITKQMDPDWIVNMSAAKELDIILPNDVWQRSRKLYLYDGQNARP